MARLFRLIPMLSYSWFAEDRTIQILKPAPATPAKTTSEITAIIRALSSWLSEKATEEAATR